MKVYAPAKNTIWAYKMECPESPTTTTTTTTEAIVVKSGEISSFSNDTSACILGLDTPVFVTNPTGALPDIFVSTSSKVFLSDGVTLFAGNGDFYKIKYDGSSITTSQRVFADGSVGTITTCP
jgi:hypothetical protein